jgi:hypothetical protein
LIDQDRVKPEDRIPITIVTGFLGCVIALRASIRATARPMIGVSYRVSYRVSYGGAAAGGRVKLRLRPTRTRREARRCRHVAWVCDRL